MNLTPIGERAVIKPLDNVVNGIIVPQKHGKGIIVHVTHDILHQGDTVVFHSYNTTRIGDYIVIDIKDIIARVQ